MPRAKEASRKEEGTSWKRCGGKYLNSVFVQTPSIIQIGAALCLYSVCICACIFRSQGWWSTVFLYSSLEDQVNFWIFEAPPNGELRFFCGIWCRSTYALSPLHMHKIHLWHYLVTQSTFIFTLFHPKCCVLIFDNKYNFEFLFPLFNYR